MFCRVAFVPQCDVLAMHDMLELENRTFENILQVALKLFKPKFAPIENR